MSKTEHVELLKGLSRLGGKRQESGPLLRPLGLGQGEVKFLTL